MTSILRHRQYRPFLLLALLAGLAGCGGYMVGGAYPPEIRTVHVPIFKSEGFRRGYEYQLTEAVQKQIQLRTPFQLAKESYADTRLTGRIVQLRKNILGETGFDDPRQLEFSMAIEVRWEETGTGRVLAEHRIPIDGTAVQLENRASFAPEVGQSLATARQETVDLLARQIVELMESPW